MTRWISIAALFFAVQTQASEGVWLAPDFFVAESRLAEVAQGFSRPAKARVSDPVSCRDRIPGLVCLVDKKEPGQTYPSRVCLPGGETYAQPFLDVFSYLTPTFQEMFCSIDRIFIEKEFTATGYAATGEGGEVYIGIRKTVLDSQLAWDKWATWKDQIAFGAAQQGSYETFPGLPFFVISQVAGVNDFLYQFIVHEFGHQFDFANNVNQLEEGCDRADPTCRFRRGTWGSLSWATIKTPHPENDFETRGGFCYYGCASANALTKAPDMYNGMWRSNFINGYSATGAWDDFADGLAYYAGVNYLKQTIHVDDGQGARYDLGAKLKSERYRKKLEYIEKFLSRTDIVYP